MSGIVHDLSPAAMAVTNDHNFQDFWRYLGRAPGMDLTDDGQLLRLVSGIPFYLFNCVSYANPPADASLTDFIEAALAPFRERRLRMWWVTGPTSRPVDLGQRLAAHGLMHPWVMPGMTIDLQTVADEPLPPGLSIVEVADEAQLRRFVGVMMPCYEIPAEAEPGLVALLAGAPFGPGQPLRHFLSVLDGTPVATASLFLSAGVAGINIVSTLPAVRGRGIGRAITRAPLLVARDLGYRAGTLQSSEQGIPVYRRLGFVEDCQLGVYIWTPPD